jgi:hypothetical protein
MVVERLTDSMRRPLRAARHLPPLPAEPQPVGLVSVESE